MTNQEALREVLAARHSLQVNPRLRLEFMASVSKLLRDHHVEAGEELLRSVVLAIPEELMNGNGSHQLLAQRAYKSKSQKPFKPPQPKPPKPPQPKPPKPPGPKPPKPPQPKPPKPPSKPPK